MVVAVPAVRMMQVPADEVVGVVTVRDRIVATSRAVRVRRIVRAAGVGGRARVRVLSADRDRTLVDVVVVDAVEVTVVKVVGVAVVRHGGVAASGTMLMGVVVVLGMGAHG